MARGTAGRWTYVADLSKQLAEMESGPRPMQALRYRVLSRQLREALAGLPEAALGADVDRDQVTEVLANRHFDSHGVLPGRGGQAWRSAAAALFDRMQRGERRDQ